MSADHRRKKDIWRLIIDDHYRKLVAIGLAVLLWFFINSRIMDSAEFLLPLKVADQQQVQQTMADSDELVVYLPTDRVVVRRFLDGDREITNVKVKLTGPRYRIDALKEARLRLKVLTLLDRQWNRRQVNGGSSESGGNSGVEIVEFTAANLERDVRREDVSIELVPPRVRLEVEIRDNYVLTVTNDRVQFDEGADLGRLRLDTAVYSPREVTLLGPAINIQKLDGQKKLFQATLNIGGVDKEVTAPLTVINGTTLKVYPEGTPTVTIQLLPLRDAYTLELPITIDDIGMEPPGQYEPEEKKMAVRVSFSGSLGRSFKLMNNEKRQAWAAANFRLEVYIKKPEIGVTYGEQLSLRPFLVPIGPLLKLHDRSDYLLEEDRAVKLRKKQ